MACVYGCVYMCVFLSFRFQRGELLIVLILWYVNVPYWVEPSEEGHQRSDSENYVKMIFPDRKLGILFILSMYISRKNTIISRSFAVIEGRILTTLFITTCGFFSTQVTNNNNGVYLLSSFYVLASKWIASPKIFCCTLCCFLCNKKMQRAKWIFLNIVCVKPSEDGLYVSISIITLQLNSMHL